MTAHMNRWAAMGGLLCVLLGLSACGGGNENKGGVASGPGASPPAPAVGVVKVSPGDVGLLTELPGRTEASRIAQVRARAAGILAARHFEEGSDVKAGQLLFTIDPAPYQAALASAQAQLARAEATLMQAQANADRAKPLLDAKAISEQESINAQAARQQALAEVATARAAVQTAQLNLGYASVTAPIAGRIGRAQVTEGALVGQGEATPLALIQQVDPLYVNFTQPAADVLRLRAAIARGQFKKAGPDAAAVTLHLEDGSTHPLPGKLLFSDLSVDPTTGQITLRAIVPNPKQTLLPGLFVRVRVEQAQAPGAMLLPQQAVSRGPQGDTVRVVGEDGMVDQRPVRVGPARDGQWVVLEGLKEGEQVMVDGFQKLRGKGPVQPVPWAPPAAGSGGSGPAGPAGSPGSKPGSAVPANASAPSTASSR
ncbi:MAG: efflux RND transporter periplasmic adaptor subunit [Betaproteobacteria bacterium]|nr:efflux RND transporter periplasmic adaptor subunit [Betaproteobacteria bacterium]